MKNSLNIDSGDCISVKNLFVICIQALDRSDEFYERPDFLDGPGQAFLWLFATKPLSTDRNRMANKIVVSVFFPNRGLYEVFSEQDENAAFELLPG